MPQLRWTLLILGVLFVILLAWIERRRQHRGFLDQGPVEPDSSDGHSSQGAGGPGPSAFREPTLTLPEMRARDPIAPHDLPVVEIEDDSFRARRVESPPAAVNPPTLSLPVMQSGPVANKRESLAEGRPVDPPAMSGSQWIRPTIEGPRVPRLDTPAAKRSAPAVEPHKPETQVEAVPQPPLSHDDGEAERAFNEAVFGEVAAVEPGNETDFELAAQVAAAAETNPDVSATGFSVEPSAAETAAGTEAGERGWPAEDEGESTIAQEGEGPVQPVKPLFTAADVTPVREPIVDWPPDDRRKVVALRLVAPPPERLPGRALRLALASEGFVLGKFQIFHKPDSSGRAVLSAANLSKPGTFDVDTMDSQRFGGLSLFAVLPGPKPPLKAFEDLLATARNLNDRLQGALQDERGGPLTPTRIAALRESVDTDLPP
jgi:cell division protein ZipA